MQIWLTIVELALKFTFPKLFDTNFTFVSAPFNQPARHHCHVKGKNLLLKYNPLCRLCKFIQSFCKFLQLKLNPNVLHSSHCAFVCDLIKFYIWSDLQCAMTFCSCTCMCCFALHMTVAKTTGIPRLGFLGRIDPRGNGCSTSSPRSGLFSF